MKKRNDFPDFVPENDDFAYQDGHPDDPQGDDPDEYDLNWADDDDPVEVAGQADMFAHEDFWNASADDSEALPEEEKVYKHSIFKPEMKKPNFVLSIAVNVIRIFAVLVLVAGLAAVGAVVGIAKGYMETAPTLDLAAIDDQAQTSFIYDANGNLITEYKGSENRVMVSIQAMPTYLQHAFIAVEDARFYTHNGVDIKRIIGAFVSNLSSSSTQGGSTITQQLIKNTLLSSEQSYKRKIQEAYLAMQLETRYTKDQILESYLNTIYLGENYYGVYTAAQGYFGKSLGELTLRECAMLAGTCNSPYYYNPRRNFYTRQKEGVDYPAITNDRTNYVLRCMYENQYITYEQYQEALDPATAHVLEKDPNTSTGMYAYAHYVEYAVDEVIDILLQLNNLEDTSANRNAMENKLRTGGYHVQLAIDTSIQSTVEDTLENWTNYPTLRDPADKEKYHDDDAMWNHAENALREVLTELGIHFTEEIGEAAFYGPKLDVNVKPAVGAEYTLSTCQLDFCLPAKFHLTYVDKDGTEKTPVVLHRAILGSLDRFMAYLIEETKGKFPTWLAPVQVKVLPVSEKTLDYAQDVTEKLVEAGVRVALDDDNQKIGYKIRAAQQVDRVPYMLVLGAKEAEAGNISVRDRKGETTTMELDAFIAKVTDEIKNRTYNA